MTPGFRFVEDPHGYFDGAEPIPSPSSVFQDLALVDTRFFTSSSRARGRAVHAGLHFALKGTLDWRTLEQELHGYVTSGLRLVGLLKPLITRFETPRMHKFLRFAGTCDIEWELDGWRWTVDWKSCKVPKVTRYQTAAYEMLARAETPLFNRWKRAAVELQYDGSIANLIRFDDHTDGTAWLNLLGAYRVRQSLRVQKLTCVNPEGVVS